MKQTPPICPYCDKRSLLVTGKAIYPHRPDLFSRHFYQCAPCAAYVGCHPGTQNPLGRLANPDLRMAKRKAHAVFDPIWKGGEKKRGIAYAWLADQLGIEQGDCHIGMFDEDMCRRVVEVCRRYQENKHLHAPA